MIHRVHPGTQKGYVLVAHTAFSKGSKGRGYSKSSNDLVFNAYVYFDIVDPIKLRRTRAKFVLGATLEVSSYEDVKDPSTLRGLPSKLIDMAEIIVPPRTRRRRSIF